MLDLSLESKQENSKKTVIVGMSGGVDSSVTALILKEQGYKVVGMFMKNWDEADENGVCSTESDYEDVAQTCSQLDIPFRTVDFVKEYKDHVFENFLTEYRKGNTPNPDILCNREIKFKAFYNKAMELGADFLATGHYCRTDGKRLFKGCDKGKDQSYFLYAISNQVLSNVLFPLGELEKSEVRDIAAKYDLPTKKKKDSTGICFIGERNFSQFLSQYIDSKKGLFKLLNGKVINNENSSITIFEFDEIDFNLSDLSSKTITAPKIQERNPLTLLSCLTKNIENKKDSFICEKSIMPEIKRELFKRFYKPIYLPILTLICCFLIINPKNKISNRKYNTIVFIVAILILVF